ncbi:MAG: D-alanyl-D-alanine carboxypeptidase [Ruminococcus sp.]|nr:D-alanyl-D-alanine carboxypeptidase [Ruminococcus sp.]
MKKFISGILAIVFLFSLSCSAFALEEDSISAPSAVLMETTTGKIVFEKNSHERRPCASITKVMTLLLVFEAIDSGKMSMDDTITASEHAATMGGSDIWLEPGETMSADDMIKATVVASANDAAVALAEHISGSEDSFVQQMNERAAELGMSDTEFKNCNGLDEDGHLTSAYDVALMSRELMKHEEIFDYTSIWLDNLRGGETQIVNTNKLLKTYNGITGLKTGTTDDAGCCMAASAERDGVKMLSVVLGCATGKERFADAAALLDYGFANYSVKELSVPEDIPTELPVADGMAKSVGIECEVRASVLTDKSGSGEITSEISIADELEAPVEKGQCVGKLTFTSGGDTLEFDITAADSVEKASFGSVFAEVLSSLLRL